MSRTKGKKKKDPSASLINERNGVNEVWLVLRYGSDMECDIRGCAEHDSGSSSHTPSTNPSCLILGFTGTQLRLHIPRDKCEWGHMITPFPQMPVHTHTHFPHTVTCLCQKSKLSLSVWKPAAYLLRAMPQLPSIPTEELHFMHFYMQVHTLREIVSPRHI